MWTVSFRTAYVSFSYNIPKCITYANRLGKCHNIHNIDWYLRFTALFCRSKRLRFSLHSSTAMLKREKLMSCKNRALMQFSEGGLLDAHMSNIYTCLYIRTCLHSCVYTKYTYTVYTHTYIYTYNIYIFM